MSRRQVERRLDLPVRLRRRLAVLPFVEGCAGRASRPLRPAAGPRRLRPCRDPVRGSPRGRGGRRRRGSERSAACRCARRRRGRWGSRPAQLPAGRLWPTGRLIAWHPHQVESAQRLLATGGWAEPTLPRSRVPGYGNCRAERTIDRPRRVCRRGRLIWYDPPRRFSEGTAGRDMTRIAIYDTTLRDGSQGEGVNFSLQDKLLITGRLDELGVDYIEGGYPLSNPKDAAYFREVADLDLNHAKVVAFGMTRRRDCAPQDDTGMQALVAAGTPAVTIVGKSWDMHVSEVLGVSLDENLRMISDSVGYLPRERPRSHLRRRALLRRLQAEPRLRPPDPPRRRRGRAPRGSCSATPTAVRCPRRSPEPSKPSAPRSTCRSASTRTTTASWRSPTRWPPSAGRNADPGYDQRDRRAVRQRRPLLGDRQPRLEVPGLRPLTPRKPREARRGLALRLRDGEHELPPRPAVRRDVRLRPQGGMHVHGVRKLASSYEHIDPALVGQREAACW